MTEAEILTLLQSYHDAQAALIGQVVSLHFALVVAVFYFLHRSGLRMKLAIFVLYTLGNLLFLGLIYNITVKVVAARAELEAMREAGVHLTRVGLSVLDSTGAPFVNVASLAANIAFVALWIGAVYFLFFWKPHPATAPVPAPH